MDDTNLTGDFYCSECSHYEKQVDKLEQEITRLKERNGKLEQLFKVAKRIEWVLSDDAAILPKSGLHALLTGYIKDCEKQDD